MRWFVAIVVAVIVLWGGYLASPYWALYRLAAAVRAGNVAEVVALVNVRALRVSLARQLSDDLAAVDKTGTLGAADVRNAAASAFAMADPALGEMITPEGLIKLLRSGRSGPAETIAVFPTASGSEGVVALLQASSWRGFRNIYFGLPPDLPAPERYRLQFRLSRLSWRLISVELPPAAQRRIAEKLLRQ